MWWPATLRFSDSESRADFCPIVEAYADWTVCSGEDDEPRFVLGVPPAELLLAHPASATSAPAEAASTTTLLPLLTIR
jgi:hypothetical protein